METDSSQRPSQLQEMPFHGDLVLLAFHPNDSIGVAPRRICENLDLTWRYQYEKFRRDPKLWGLKAYRREGDDPDAQLFLIPFQRVGSWLYTIHTSKLPASPNQKLRVYKEALVAAIEEFARQRAERLQAQQTPPTVPTEPAEPDAEPEPEPMTEPPIDPEPEPDFEAPEEESLPWREGPAPHDEKFTSPFDRIIEYDEHGQAIWRARRLMPVLGYGDWDRVPNVIDRAIASCLNTGLNPDDHIRASSSMVDIGSGAQREVKDYILTRHGCYLVSMNGDPRKPEIAAAQQYFVIRTHHSEEVERNGISTHNLMVMMTQNLTVLTNGHVELKRAVKQAQDDVQETKQFVAQAMRDAKEAQQEMAAQAARIAELEKSSPPPDHMTVAAFARHKGMPDLPISTLKEWGAKLKAECGYRGITPIKVPVVGKPWPYVNSYPIELIEETFEEFGPQL